jgi:starch synthase
MNILMVAAENDALPGGKVGGIGDVVRDIPHALANAGHQVSVITPGYGIFSRLEGARFQAQIAITFAGHTEIVDLFEVPSRCPQQGVRLWALEHPLFTAGGIGSIYCNDPSDRPFATDASKFALFCSAVCQAIMDYQFGDLDVLHLHDWHAANVALLRAYDPRYTRLQELHTVYTIHNLALQGIRPLGGDSSALLAWFPNLSFQHEVINDPHVTHCVNLMRCGINLSDRVHAVSPSYAEEILSPSHHEQGYFGGEGLQDDLQMALATGRLHGILNGCEYPEQSHKALSLNNLLKLCEDELLKWVGKTSLVESAHLVSMHRLHRLSAVKRKKSPFLMTSVGRITEQKVLLLQQVLPSGKTALSEILETLGDQGLFLMLGSGDAELEQFLTQEASLHSNFIYLKGYSEALPDAIYNSGDLFLMPSSFEPCGISQMLAMRAGQPCLVHAVGGLRDTVKHNETGFVFSGSNLLDQASNMIEGFKQALKMYQSDMDQWKSMSESAAKKRFLWSDVAEEYVRLLYSK